MGDRRKLEMAYDGICREYAQSLARLASSYESAPDARQDLLQEIYLALWKALPAFRGECSMRTFVYRVAHNRALTHVWRRRTHAVTRADFVDPPDPSPTPETAAIARADTEALMHAVRELPVAYRQAITMALEDLAQAEIAAVLGISENNVAVRLNRARKLLRQQLESKE